MHANRESAPDVQLYQSVRDRRDATVARLSVARKIGKRVYHTLHERDSACCRRIYVIKPARGETAPRVRR